MIRISFDHFFIFHNAFAVGVLAVFWLRKNWRESAESWNISQETLGRCNKCHLTFLTKRIETLVRCPSCNQVSRIRSKKSSRRMRY